MKYLSFRKLLTHLCLAAFVSQFLLQPSTSLARTAVANNGQLVFARQVSINNINAISGQTVFSGNRFKVANQGTAIVNLGRLGRIELGANSEFILRVSGNTIGGELKSGCMNLSAPANVGVQINTEQGLVTSSGKLPVALALGAKGKATDLSPTLGEINVAGANQTSVIKAGEFASLAANANGPQNLVRRTADACAKQNGACLVCNLNASPNATSPNANPKGPAPQNNKGGGGGIGWGLATGMAAMVAGTALAIGLTNNNRGPVRRSPFRP